jgi:hypothetical protein
VRADEQLIAFLQLELRIWEGDRCDSLLFGTWRGLDFVAAALRRAFLVRNILADL